MLPIAQKLFAIQALGENIKLFPATSYKKLRL